VGLVVVCCHPGLQWESACKRIQVNLGQNGFKRPQNVPWGGGGHTEKEKKIRKIRKKERKKGRQEERTKGRKEERKKGRKEASKQGTKGPTGTTGTT
jgi:hypothetical protein